MEIQESATYVIHLDVDPPEIVANEYHKRYAAI